MVKITVGIYINKDDRVFVFENVDCSPVAGDVDAPLVLSVARERMIVEQGMERILQKQITSVFERFLNF